MVAVEEEEVPESCLDLVQIDPPVGEAEGEVLVHCWGARQHENYPTSFLLLKEQVSEMDCVSSWDRRREEQVLYLVRRRLASWDAFLCRRRLLLGHQEESEDLLAAPSWEDPLLDLAEVLLAFHPVQKDLQTEDDRRRRRNVPSLREKGEEDRRLADHLDDSSKPMLFVRIKLRNLKRQSQSISLV